MKRVVPFFLALALCLSACPAQKNDSRATRPRPVRGGTLVVSLAEDADFLDPQRASQPEALALMRVMHRGLMAFPAEQYPNGLDPVPDLAAAPPEVSADGLLYTFKIREGAAFGPPASRPLKAADVRAGLVRLLASSSPFMPYFRIVAAVAALDDETVVIRLARPSNDLLWLLALPAASAIPAELMGDKRPPLAAISPSGPYRLADKDGYLPERGMHLVRNTSWTRESDPVRPAYVDEIRVRIGDSPAVMQSAVSDGTVDLSLDTPPDLAAVPSPAPGNPRVITVPSGCLRYLWMNTTVKPFNDANVRRAVSTSISREAVVAAGGGARMGVPATSVLVRGIAGAPSAAGAVPSPDPSSAAQTFAALTLPRGFSTTFIVGDRDLDLAQARVVAAALAAAKSFPIRVSSVPIASVYVDYYEIPARKVPMGIATWCADWPGLAGRGALAPLLAGGAFPRSANQNYALLNDVELNRLMTAAASAPANEAVGAWAAAAARADRLAAIVPLVDMNEVSLVSARVNVLASPMFPRGDLAATWIDPRVVVSTGSPTR